MTRGEAIKDFFCKTILPVAAAALLYCIFRSACVKTGELDYASTSKQGTTLNSCCFFKHHTDKNKPPTTPTNPNQSHPPVGNE